MSAKNTSTITKKPTATPPIEAWIGGASVNAGAEPAEQARPESQHVYKTASLQSDEQTEGEAMAMLSARVPAALVRRLRIQAATEGRHIQEIVAQLLKDYLGEDEGKA